MRIAPAGQPTLAAVTTPRYATMPEGNGSDGATTYCWSVEWNLCQNESGDHCGGFFDLIWNARYRRSVVSIDPFSGPRQGLSFGRPIALEWQRIDKLGRVL